MQTKIYVSGSLKTGSRRMKIRAWLPDGLVGCCFERKRILTKKAA